MADREKLIELIGEATHYLLRTAQISAMADYFIANGVVIQKQGEWIPQDDSRTTFQCSNCKAENNEGYETYCPKCGAKMKEVK